MAGCEHKAVRWELVGKSRGLPTGSVQCALQDREGSIWIGLNGAGVARWLGYPYWESWTDEEGLASENVWSLHRDHAGILLEHLNSPDYRPAQIAIGPGGAVLLTALTTEHERWHDLINLARKIDAAVQ